MKLKDRVLVENDNWEPAVWGTDSFTCDDSDKIWIGIKDIVQKRIKEWDEVEETTF